MTGRFVAGRRQSVVISTIAWTLGWWFRARRTRQLRFKNVAALDDYRIRFRQALEDLDNLRDLYQNTQARTPRLEHPG